jgi:hypothetical protein
MSFNALPAELLTKIVKNTAVARNIGFTLYDDTDVETEGWPEAWDDDCTSIQVGHKYIDSLSRTNKRMRDVCTPILFSRLLVRTAQRDTVEKAGCIYTEFWNGLEDLHLILPTRQHIGRHVRYVV